MLKAFSISPVFLDSWKLYTCEEKFAVKPKIGNPINFKEFGKEAANMTQDFVPLTT